MKSRIDAAGRSSGSGLPAAAIVTGLVAAFFAATGAAEAGTAAHDLDIVRTVGVGFSGPGGAFRALDLLVAAPAMLLPIGSRVLRAGLASAVVTGICAALAFGIARELVTIVASAIRRREGGQAPSPRLVTAVSAVAVLTAVLAPAWQSEASAPGGSVTGALVVLLALSVGTSDEDGWIPRAALALGLAASYEPFVLLATAAAVAPRMVLALRGRSLTRADAIHGAVAFVVGLTPMALGFLLARRPLEPAIVLTGAPFALGDRADAGAVVQFASTHVGVLLLIVSAVGAGLSFYVKEAWRIALPLAAVTLAGVVALRFQAGTGGALLAGVLAMYMLGATALGAVVLAIARARVPFAEASAALVVVLEIVLPVRSLDETSTRREARAPYASSVWNDIAWGSAPPAALVLVSDRGTMKRVASARATGELRADLVFVPSFDIHGREGQRALLQEPKLAPLYRDLALGVAPEELSLSQLGAQRPVLATFDPRWDRSLSRHLVPVGLTSRFEPEPRGASDWKKALDEFVALKDRLVRIAVAKKDAELAGATATLLRARAVGMAATGERDILSRALDDLRAFAPEDATSATLVRRMVTNKGAIDVRDLSP